MKKFCIGIVIFITYIVVLCQFEVPVRIMGVMGLAGIFCLFGLQSMIRGFIKDLRTKKKGKSSTLLYDLVAIVFLGYMLFSCLDIAYGGIYDINNGTEIIVLEDAWVKEVRNSSRGRTTYKHYINGYDENNQLLSYAIWKETYEELREVHIDTIQLEVYQGVKRLKEDNYKINKHNEYVEPNSGDHDKQFEITMPDIYVVDPEDIPSVPDIDFDDIINQ